MFGRNRYDGIRHSTLQCGQHLLSAVSVEAKIVKGIPTLAQHTIHIGLASFFRDHAETIVAYQ